MVPWGLAARASVFFMSAQPDAKRPDRAGYAANTAAAIQTLQDNWYNLDTGIWDRAWWNSGNAFTTLADFATIDVAAANQLNIGGILRHTFIRAQGEQVRATKTMDESGLVASSYDITMLGIDTLSTALEDVDVDAGAGIAIARRQQFPGFINEFYDDEGWWALGLIRAYDVMRDQAYLDMAVSIFEDMKTGGDTYCGGGIYWNKERKYVNAISNELYLAVAASLANRLPDAAARAPYLDLANRQWAWFRASGMINARGTINDGLNGSCKNNGQNTWSYNQGVVLGGLVELHRATGDAALLAQATDIAAAAIRELSGPGGVLRESCEPDCGADGNQFKGIFVRNLRYLYEAATPRRADFRKFILDNADSNWAANRDERGRMGVVWSGPPQRMSGPTHSSALDALVAAVAVI